MEKEHFDLLVKAVRQMNRHMAGKVVRGAKATELTEPAVRAIREAAKPQRSARRSHLRRCLPIPQLASLDQRGSM